MRLFVAAILSALAAACATAPPPEPERADPLPSWNDTESKRAIIAFVARVTDASSPDFVGRDARIAVFDNDGTLWTEQPMYNQLAFAFDRVRAMAPDHPEWLEKEPFKSVLAGDVKKAVAGGEEALLQILYATHAGMTTDEFTASVEHWIRTARHPATGRAYTDMVYKPQVELLNWLGDEGFKTFIVSGGGIDVMRPWTQVVYGIPPEQVVGSSLKARYEVRDGMPVIVKEPAIDFLDDKAGKPVAIQKFIGRRPILAVGNSDGDFEMLEYTTSGPGPRLGVLVHHDDAAREWAYDRESQVGKLARGLDEAPGRGWIVVSMKDDWSRIYPGQ
jgi:phosphoglycolate phosphatase-like HAD superfamily hydrolase